MHDRAWGNIVFVTSHKIYIFFLYNLQVANAQNKYGIKQKNNFKKVHRVSHAK